MRMEWRCSQDRFSKLGVVLAWTSVIALEKSGGDRSSGSTFPGLIRILFRTISVVDSVRITTRRTIGA